MTGVEDPCFSGEEVWGWGNPKPLSKFVVLKGLLHSEGIAIDSARGKGKEKGWCWGGGGLNLAAKGAFGKLPELTRRVGGGGEG